MQFPGFTVAGDENRVIICPTLFDETELSERSDWRETHQNANANLTHGYVRWGDALADIERRLGVTGHNRILGT